MQTCQQVTCTCSHHVQGTHLWYAARICPCVAFAGTPSTAYKSRPGAEVAERGGGGDCAPCCPDALRPHWSLACACCCPALRAGNELSPVRACCAVSAASIAASCAATAAALVQPPLLLLLLPSLARFLVLLLWQPLDPGSPSEPDAVFPHDSVPLLPPPLSLFRPLLPPLLPSLPLLLVETPVGAAADGRRA